MIPATLQDKTLVVDILSESFDSNKSVNYVIKQDQKKAQRIRGLMEYSFDKCFKYGQIWLNEEKNACALIMLPSTFSFQSLLMDIRFALQVAGSLNIIRKASNKEADVKKHHPRSPFLHLWFIGVKKQHQGKGLGTQLIREIEANNHQQLPIYLETSTERNVPFYQKLGFQSYHQNTYYLSDQAFQFYMMKKVYQE